MPIFLSFVFIIACSACKAKQSESAEKPSTDSLTYDELAAHLQQYETSEVILPNSSKIHKLEYFPESKHLAIYFQRQKDKSYLYGKVSAELWSEFKAAESKGRFYSKSILHNETLQLIRRK